MHITRIAFVNFLEVISFSFVSLSTASDISWRVNISLWSHHRTMRGEAEAFGQQEELPDQAQVGLVFRVEVNISIFHEQSKIV